MRISPAGGTKIGGFRPLNDQKSPAAELARGAVSKEGGGVSVRVMISILLVAASQQLLGAGAGEIDPETRAEVMNSMFQTIAKGVGVLILVLLFAWMRSRMLNRARQAGERRAKPWEKDG